MHELKQREEIKHGLKELLMFALLSTQSKPISSGQSSVIQRFLNSNSLAIDLDKSDSIASRIVEVMHGVRTADFKLYATSNPETTYHIPPSLFLLHSIADFLDITIFLFDVSRKPRLSGDPRTSAFVVGLFHDHSAVLGLSDFHVLTCTRTDWRIRVIPLVPAPIPPGPAAMYHSEKRLKQDMEGCDVDLETCQDVFTKEWYVLSQLCLD